MRTTNLQTRSFRSGAAIALAVLVVIASASCGAQTPEDLHKLFQSGKVFALRDAVQGGDAPTFYRGAVEASLNHIEEAASTLHEVIRAAPDSEDAYQAHDLLANVYQRNGLYREALQELDAAIQERPKSEELQNARPLFAACSRQGDMTVVSRRATTLHRMKDGELPFRIHGRSDGFSFDTGAAISIMSEREAQYLGLTPQSVNTRINDSSGNGVGGIRVAIAADMVIGGLHLRNVPFLVVSDNDEPFVEYSSKQGHRGLIGLPILLAMQSVRWSRHEFEFDFRPQKTTESSNLLFHETNPVVQVMVDDRNLDFTLDTGAIGTDLNPLFAKEFPALISSGKKETNKITGVGGTREYDSVLLSSVSLSVGGRIVTLAPAHVSIAQGLGGNSMWAGNLGNAELNQAHSIAIDFRDMSLKLE